MKIVNYYECEICGTTYTDKAKCEACEASHKKPIKITGCEYQVYKVNATGFPDTITVATKDGEKAVYKFLKYKDIQEEEWRKAEKEGRNDEDYMF